MLSKKNDSNRKEREVDLSTLSRKQEQFKAGEHMRRIGDIGDVIGTCHGCTMPLRIDEWMDRWMKGSGRRYGR